MWLCEEDASEVPDALGQECGLAGAGAARRRAEVHKITAVQEVLPLIVAKVTTC